MAGIEDAFVMFNDLFGDLDLYVGQFQVSDPLFKREIRLPYEDYHIYGSKPGGSDIDLTYDRGLMLTYGFNGGTDLTLEVVNGNGIGERANLFSNFDDDTYKNVLLRVSQDVGAASGSALSATSARKQGRNGLVNPWMAGGDATGPRPSWSSTSSTSSAATPTPIPARAPERS